MILLRKPAVLLALLVLGAACGEPKRSRSPRRRGVESTTVVPTYGASAVQADSDYVERTLKAQMGSLPQMGWLVPPHFLLAEGTPVQVAVLSTDRSAPLLQDPEVLPTATKDSIRKEHWVACTVDTVSQFRTPFEVGKPSRALVYAKPFRDAVVTGFAHPALSPAQLAAGRALTELGDTVRWRDSTFALTPSGSYFGVHAAYARSGALIRSVLYYVNSSGVTLAKRVLNAEAYSQCDGCGVPQYSESFGRVYNVLNVLRLPGFTKEVLLYDSSTNEGQALSLLTVTPLGNLNEARVYEYVVTCDRDEP